LKKIGQTARDDGVAAVARRARRAVQQTGDPVNYRPVCDVWILARSKVKYHGAYPSGFLHRARALLGVGPDGAVLHVCAGKVREYPFAGFGRFDKTLDLDPACHPDYLHDARRPLPWRDDAHATPWDAALIDRPYTLEDAAQYAPGREALPPVNLVLRHALGVVAVGARVGVLDYTWPQPPVWAKEVAVVAVGTGRNGRARWFTVFVRLPVEGHTGRLLAGAQPAEKGE
jgi:hypothetical protein